MISMETNARILKKRTSGMPDDDHYLVFTLADEQFAIEVSRLLQIRSWGDITPIPDTPDYVLGMTDLQGSDLVVVDLRKRLMLPCTPPTSRTLVIVLRFMWNGVTLPIGFTVDSSTGAQSLLNRSHKPLPDEHCSISGDFVRGTALVDEQRVILLETNRLVDREVLAREATIRQPDSREIH